MVTYRTRIDAFCAAVSADPKPCLSPKPRVSWKGSKAEMSHLDGMVAHFAERAKGFFHSFADQITSYWIVEDPLPTDIRHPSLPCDLLYHHQERISCDGDASARAVGDRRPSRLFEGLCRAAEGDIRHPCVRGSTC